MGGRCRWIRTDAQLTPGGDPEPTTVPDAGSSDPAPADSGPSADARRPGEPRWPMALAVLATGVLRAALPPQLRAGDSRWLYLVVIAVLLGVLIIGDPGRIDRDKRWLRVTTDLTHRPHLGGQRHRRGQAGRHILSTQPFTNDANILLVSGGAIWLTNVIAFGLWYWDVDGGGAAARARGPVAHPAFVFPEMVNPQFVAAGWYPKFVDYLHLSFTAATAFSPTDVSAVKPWAKLMMMAEETISLVVALLGGGPGRQHPQVDGPVDGGADSAGVASPGSSGPEALDHGLLDAGQGVPQGPLPSEPLGQRDHRGPGRRGRLRRLGRHLAGHHQRRHTRPAWRRAAPSPPPCPTGRCRRRPPRR